MREPVPRWLLGAGVTGLVFMAVGFSQTFVSLWRSWMNNPNYSHGVLILPVSVFLVWWKRKELEKIGLRTSWLGACLLGAGVFLQLVGIRGDVTIFQGWALLAVIAGLVWALFGGSLLRKVLFPIAFLIFMVPALPVFMNTVSFRLKEVAAESSVWLASAIGAPVVQRGMNLHFPSGTMTVENACSGLNSLISLMALGALFAYVGTGVAWKRWTLFGLTMPIAIAANVFRITLLCVAAAVTSTEQASGTFHDVGGFVIFGVALVLLAISRKVLKC